MPRDHLAELALIDVSRLQREATDKEIRRCNVPDCQGDARHSARGRKGFCNKHYLRFRRHGDPLAGGDPRRSHEDALNLLTGALYYGGDNCIEWPSCNGHGYGQIQIDGQFHSVHRLVCTSAHGPAPADFEAAHNCGNRSCINPRHLRWATGAENQADRLAHGTDLRGERHPRARLTNSQARQIYAMKGTTSQQRIADTFGISRSQVSAIHRKEIWLVALNEEVA